MHVFTYCMITEYIITERTEETSNFAQS